MFAGDILGAFSRAPSGIVYPPEFSRSIDLDLIFIEIAESSAEQVHQNVTGMERAARTGVISRRLRCTQTILVLMRTNIGISLGIRKPVW